MDQKTESHLLALKAALQTLKDSGLDGFEGLLAVVLGEVCGQPFRVASSGAQRGRDGDSAFDSGATYFEAKLYQDAVPQSAVAGKIVDLANDENGQVDTWIICATGPINSQHADKYRGSLSAFGIGCLILDWQPGILPSMAVLLAMAAPQVQRFVLDNSQNPTSVVDVRLHLDAVAADSQFSVMSTSLKSMVCDGSVGLGLMKHANHSALIAAFSDRREARRQFGQPLAPLDTSGLPWTERPALIQRVHGAIAGAVDPQVLLLVGSEGTGKSWLVARAWCVSDPAPLLVAFSAAELSLPSAMNNLQELLVAKLSAQSGDILTDEVRKRWKRRFDGWRANVSPQHVRIAVWVDGLNQHPNFPWPRWIDAMAQFLNEIGGKLVLTTNSWHFAQIRSVMTSPLDRVVVDEWNNSELKGILDAKGIRSDALAADVFDFLRNPRILGIAVELLDAQEIEGVEELTTGRLLFEHIRRHDRDAMSSMSAREFAKTLQTHAETILERLTAQKSDDLTIFDFEKSLNSVSESRFFEPVEGESDLYAIRKEGLPLALGLALTSTLRKEARAGRDPMAKLAMMMEPISALSETSSVVFAALQISVLQDGGLLPVQAALAQYFVGLQNVPDELLPAFGALARRDPRAFLKATEETAFSKVRLPNARWLILALHSASAVAANAATISTYAQEWLCRYSRAAEVGTLRDAGHDPQRYKQAVERLQQELQTRLVALSPSEQEFVSSALKEETRKGLPELHLYALTLLAGKPLVNAIPALVGWAYGNALNYDVRAPEREFRHLIRFNAVDWQATRDAIRAACEFLFTAETSATSKKAAAIMLSATGDPDDATRSIAVFETLNHNPPRFPRVEDPNYSPVDPCDPTTSAPANIDAIAAANRNIDVSTLRTGLGMTAQDHMATRSLPALARFQPETAIEVFRTFAREAVGRTDKPGLRQALQALLKHSAILEPETVRRLTSIGCSPLSSKILSRNGNLSDDWMIQQYALRVSFPHKAGDEQLENLITSGTREVLLDLLEATAPASEAGLNTAVEHAVAAYDDNALAIALSFAQFNRTPISAAVKSYFVTLLGSTDRELRTSALALIARTQNEDLVKHFLNTGWTAENCDPKTGSFEVWNGSRCILLAARLNLIDATEAVARIGMNFYGSAAQLNDEGAKAVADRADAAFQRALGMSDIPEVPLVEQSLPVEDDQKPPLLSMVDQPEVGNIFQAFERLSESEDAFQQRRQKSWRAFDRLLQQITVAEARIMLDDFSWSGFDALVAYDQALAQKWKHSLLTSEDTTFRWMHAFATGLARAIAPIDPQGAGSLFERVIALKPYVNRVTGASSIPSEAVAMWSRASISGIRKLCFARLDGAMNDAQIAAEMIAAELAGGAEFVRNYVEGRLAVEEPAKTARALMVCGLSDVSEHADHVLQRFDNAKGFIGGAHRAAEYAYRRNAWSRHWYGKMRNAANADEFWKHAILFAKIVDGRFDLWRDGHGTCSDVFSRFFTTVEDDLDSRIKKWRSNRQSKLFGREIPDAIFVLGQQGS